MSISLQLKERAEIPLVCIDYRDDGVGIAPAEQSKVFDPFYTTTRGSGGSGLGMSISYNIIVSKLKGNIQCVDAEQGVHFVIEFPIHTVD